MYELMQNLLTGSVERIKQSTRSCPFRGKEVHLGFSYWFTISSVGLKVCSLQNREKERRIGWSIGRGDEIEIKRGLQVVARSEA